MKFKANLIELVSLDVVKLHKIEEKDGCVEVESLVDGEAFPKECALILSIEDKATGKFHDMAISEQHARSLVLGLLSQLSQFGDHIATCLLEKISEIDEEGEQEDE